MSRISCSARDGQTVVYNDIGEHYGALKMADALSLSFARLVSCSFVQGTRYFRAQLCFAYVKDQPVSMACRPLRADVPGF